MVFGKKSTTKLSNTKREKISVIRQSNGTSFVIVLFFTLIGLIIAASPIIISTFIMQLPTTLDSAILPFPDITLLNDIAISGAQVPKAIIVRAITTFGTFR